MRLSYTYVASFPDSTPQLFIALWLIHRCNVSIYFAFFFLLFFYRVSVKYCLSSTPVGTQPSCETLPRASGHSWRLSWTDALIMTGRLPTFLRTLWKNYVVYCKAVSNPLIFILTKYVIVEPKRNYF